MLVITGRSCIYECTVELISVRYVEPVKRDVNRMRYSNVTPERKKGERSQRSIHY